MPKGNNRIPPKRARSIEGGQHLGRKELVGSLTHGRIRVTATTDDDHVVKAE